MLDQRQPEQGALMGTPYIVTLDIRNSAASGPGWTNVAASNGSIYCYQFAGGTDGAGNVDTTTRGSVDVALRVIAASQYTVSKVNITSDKEKQLDVKSTGLWEALINDKNDKVESDGYFQVLMNDTAANCTLLCDPKISNDPT
jgi:hypothetical protein